VSNKRDVDLGDRVGAHVELGDRQPIGERAQHRFDPA